MLSFFALLMALSARPADGLSALITPPHAQSERHIDIARKIGEYLNEFYSDTSSHQGDIRFQYDEHPLLDMPLMMDCEGSDVMCLEQTAKVLRVSTLVFGEIVVLERPKFRISKFMLSSNPREPGKLIIISESFPHWLKDSDGLMRDWTFHLARRLEGAKEGVFFYEEQEEEVVSVVQVFQGANLAKEGLPGSPIFLAAGVYRVALVVEGERVDQVEIRIDDGTQRTHGTRMAPRMNIRARIGTDIRMGETLTGIDGVASVQLEMERIILTTGLVAKAAREGRSWQVSTRIGPSVSLTPEVGVRPSIGLGLERRANGDYLGLIPVAVSLPFDTTWHPAPYVQLLFSEKPMNSNTAGIESLEVGIELTKSLTKAMHFGSAVGVQIGIHHTQAEGSAFLLRLFGELGG